jgi:acyl-CoA carboxylase subunit beta
MKQSNNLPEHSLKCPGCENSASEALFRSSQYVCSICGYYLPMPAQDRLAALADEKTWREFDAHLVSADPLGFADPRPYRERLRDARRETGLREAAVTGRCRIADEEVVLVVLDFRFLGGTMGSAVGEKVANAFEYATRRRLPLVSVVGTGGARVQEGMLSLMQMAKVSAVAAHHNSAGLAFISILTNPTFGGVAASFASLGDLIIAEAGAQIGFVGPRVIEQTTGIAPHPGSHRAETLLQNGLVDMVLGRRDIRGVLVYLLTHIKSRDGGSRQNQRLPRPSRSDRVPAWQKVTLARHIGRPTAQFFIAEIFTNFLELHGDRQGGDDPAIACGLAQIGNQTVMLIAQERGHSVEEKAKRNGGKAFPEGYRKAVRLMKLAAKYRLPIITFIDTPGAQTTYESERRGIAGALAQTLATMATLPTRSIAVIIGEGGSGGAIALGVADRVLMFEHSIYSVISPEGAASILFRDVSHAEGVSERLKLTAKDLLHFGIIDKIVPEPNGGAHLDPQRSAETLKAYVLSALRELNRISSRDLLTRRYRKYRHIGEGGVYWREELRTVMKGLVGGFLSRSKKATRSS